MSENEKLPPPVNLKHRLVGAAMLVAAAVIVLPLVLREQEPPAELKDAAETPPRETVVEQAPPAVTEYVPPAPAPDAIANTKPASTAEKSDTAAAPPKAVAVAARPTRGWVVQVGVFANPANAAKLADRLKGQGHEVMLDHVTHQNAKRLRLRVGPFTDKPQAIQAQAKIQQATGLAGAVLGYP